MRRKLTSEQIATVRQLEELIARNQGLKISLKALAERFGVSARSIGRILNGFTYKGETGREGEQ